MTFNKLIKKYKKKEIKVGIVGIGYVGLKLLLQFGNNNVRVIGFDKDETRIEELGNGYDRTNEIETIDYVSK